jgi:DNA-binding CsgD family transcriptional regulator
MFLVRTFIRDHSWVIWIGLLTGGAIVLSQVVSLFVIYRYLKMDYYLCLVAVCFGAAGWVVNKRRVTVDTAPLLADEMVVCPIPPKASGEDLLTVLTSKEVLVLRLLAESKTNKEIAAALFVEVSTIKTQGGHQFAVGNRPFGWPAHCCMGELLHSRTVEVGAIKDQLSSVGHRVARECAN